MRRLVLTPIVAVLVFAACGTGAELPQLPLSAGGAAKDSAALAGGMMPYRNVRYELADGVQADKDAQDAFKFEFATRDDVTRIAKVFGVTGEIRGDEHGWRIGATTEDPERKYSVDLEVAKSGQFGVNSPYAVSSGVGCAEPDRPVASDESAVDSGCSAPTTTTIDRRLPSDDEAKAKARSLLTDAGADLAHTQARVERYGENVAVHLQPMFDGQAIDGLEYGVTFGPHSLVVSAQGSLGTPKKVGRYDLATLQRAVERLNEQPKIYPAIGRAIAEPAPADDIVVKLVAVDVGLTFSYDDNERSIWLTPAYIFATDQEHGQVVTAAAADKYFPTTTPSTNSDTSPTVTGPSTGGGSSGSGGETVPPAPPPNPPVNPPATTAPNCMTTTEPISAQVCSDKTQYVAGDTVHFTITASDPDRAFSNGPCYDGVTAEYGDGGGGDVRCLACSTSVADGPGKLSSTRDHAYAKTGKYAAKFTIKSGSECGAPDPHDSQVELTLPIPVA